MAIPTNLPVSDSLYLSIGVSKTQENNQGEVVEVSKASGKSVSEVVPCDTNAPTTLSVSEFYLQNGGTIVWVKQDK